MSGQAYHEGDPEAPVQVPLPVLQSWSNLLAASAAPWLSYKPLGTGLNNREQGRRPGPRRSGRG
jgi:hypothetical protein